MIRAWAAMTKVSSIQRTATVVAMLVVAGCGGAADTKPTAKVSGKVTMDGQPVTGGSLIFSPIATGKATEAGKAGDATIKSDGTFVVTTYAPNDGAVVGQHRVSFMPPAVTTPAATPGAAHVEATKNPFDGMVLKTTEVTVAKGENKIELELVKSKP